MPNWAVTGSKLVPQPDILFEKLLEARNVDLQTQPAVPACRTVTTAIIITALAPFPSPRPSLLRLRAVLSSLHTTLNYAHSHAHCSARPVVGRSGPVPYHHLDL